MIKQLGRLKRVDLRDVWSKEAGDFTPWLAQDENLSLIGETIGLELEAQEKNVGPFRADLLCKDTATDSWVLIENQLERTDHTPRPAPHLRCRAERRHHSLGGVPFRGGPPRRPRLAERGDGQQHQLLRA